MRKHLIGLAAAAVLVAGPAHAEINSFIAILTGANEVPAGGATDGVGIASVVIDDVANTVSWSIISNNIALPLTLAHIHAGAAGVSGPVIVDFSGQLSGALLFDADLASITPANAANFYVNLHNAAYPGGAIRGQLHFTGSTAQIQLIFADGFESCPCP